MLFNDTIYYNIAYGRLGASREEVEEAARQVGGGACCASAGTRPGRALRAGRAAAVLCARRVTLHLAAAIATWRRNA